MSTGTATFTYLHAYILQEVHIMSLTNYVHKLKSVSWSLTFNYEILPSNSLHARVNTHINFN